MNINQEQLDDYISRLNQEFEIEFYELFSKNANENEEEIELKLNKEKQKLIRLVAVKDNKTFLKSKKIIKRELAKDLKTVYQASTEEIGYTNLLELDEKWKSRYPGAIQSWIDNWEVLSVFFKFSAEIRKIMYTTNVIESLNSTYKRINRNRDVFPTDMSLLKVLYLSTLKAEKKWSRMMSKWNLCLSQFRIMYEGRI